MRARVKNTKSELDLHPILIPRAEHMPVKRMGVMGMNAWVSSTEGQLVSTSTVKMPVGRSTRLDRHALFIPLQNALVHLWQRRRAIALQELYERVVGIAYANSITGSLVRL